MKPFSTLVLIFGLLISSKISLISQCDIAKFIPSDPSKVEVYALYIDGGLEKIAELSYSSITNVDIISSQNVIAGQQREITHMAFASICKPISAEAINTNGCIDAGGAGYFCKSTFECMDDFGVWTLPIKSIDKCEDIFFTYENDGFALQFIVHYLLGDATECAEILSPLNLATNVDLSPIIEWESLELAGATGYKISVGTYSNGTDIMDKLDVGNVTSFTLNNLLPNTTYYCTIIPYFGDFERPECSEISFTTKNNKCDFCCTYPSSFYDCVGFEDYNIGNITPQGSPKFTLFNSESSNALVNSNFVLSGTKSLKFVNGSDIDYNISRSISEQIPTRLEWAMYIPKDKAGAWGLETNNTTNYPIFTYYDKGIASVFIRSNNINTKVATFNYTQSTWLKSSLIFQPFENEIEFWANGKFIYKITNYTSNVIADFNMFAIPDVNYNEFYIDNICYQEFTNAFILCSDEGPKVCANDVEYTNSCYASLSGYSDCELKIGGCNNDVTCPEILTPINNATNQPLSLTITWSSVNGATGYRISVGTSPNGTQILNRFFVGNANSHVLNNLANNTKYYCVIYPVFGSVETFDCPAITFTTENVNTNSCYFCCSFPSNYSDCIGFEQLNLGSLIPQGSHKFTLFSPTSGGGEIVASNSFEASNALKLVNLSNIDLNISRTINEFTPARLEWNMRIPTGKAGRFGMETRVPDAYPIEVTFNSGTAKVYNTTNGATTLKGNFNYIQNSWIRIVLIFRPYENKIELWINGKFIYEVTDYQSNLVTDLNLSGISTVNNNEFYIDAICYLEFFSTINCSSEYEPVCHNNVEFQNECYAYFGGYTECEKYNSGCSTVSVHDNIIQDNVLVFPNPSNGELTVQNKTDFEMDFTIVNSIGELVLKGKLDKDLSIDLSQNPNGLYLMKFSYNNIIMTKKITLIRVC